MSLVEVLNRYPARKERFRDWIGLVAATLVLVGVVSLAAWRHIAVHGALLAFGISAGLLFFSWFASLTKVKKTWKSFTVFLSEREAEKQPSSSPEYSPANPLAVMEQPLQNS